MTSSSSSSPEISGAASQDRFSYKHATHEEVLEDLSSRFILNLPDDELSSLERICFQVEQAHWFYEDFIREENPKFPSLPLKKFSAMLFHACPLLHQWSHDHEQAFNTFMQYKTRVPVCGAIMLNETWEKCVLVKGWKSSSGWGFPKGKINQIEPPANCAIREVLEETGYNLAGQIDPENLIEMSIREQKISLFIVPGVPENYPFKTKTRKEISKIEWFKLTDLPTWKRNKTAAGRFYLISPFIGALKAFINERRPRNVPRKGLRPRKPQPSHSRKESGYLIYNDATQESSSQSSSAENGEPQTPSPQYSESHANPIPQVAEPEIPQSDLANVPMDPHFAQLLSALAISASGTASRDTNETKKSSPLPPSITTDHQDYQDISTPVPITASSTTSDVLSDMSSLPDGPDWSSCAPKHISPQVPTINDSTFCSKTPSSSPPKPLPRTTQSPVLGSGAGGEAGVLPSPRRPMTLLSNDTATSPATTMSPRPTSSSIPDAARSSHSSLVSSAPTADRSKHIALLEAVSAESAKLMQAYKVAAANGVPANVSDHLKNSLITGFPPSPSMASQVPGIQLHDTHRTFNYPVSPGLTHAMLPQDLSGGRVLYASPSTNGTETALFPATRDLGLSPPMHDPFQVRSRTSLSVHRSPMNPPGRASMSQSQLLALMNGHRAISQTPQVYPQPPHTQVAPYPPFQTPVPGSMPSAAVRHPGHAFYPAAFPAHQSFGPFSPASSLSVHTTDHQSSQPPHNTLLSILNSGRSASRVGNVAPYHPLPNGRG